MIDVVVTCGICGRPVDGTVTEYLPAFDRWIVKAYCHGSVDQMVVNAEFSHDVALGLVTLVRAEAFGSASPADKASGALLTRERADA